MSLPYGQEYDEDGFPIDPGCTPPIDTGAPHRPDLHVYRDAPGVHPDPNQWRRDHPDLNRKVS